MEHPDVAYRLAVEHQLELERAVAASRSRRPVRRRFTAIVGALARRSARRPVSLFEQLRAKPVPRRRSEADSPLFD